MALPSDRCAAAFINRSRVEKVKKLEKKNKELEEKAKKSEEVGIQKGRKEGKIETARNMLRKAKFTLEDIAEVTGLTLEEINELK